jgi:putative peptidoglycan lipid II flippase
LGEDLRASGRVSASILVSRVLGVGREVVFAGLFGAGAIADAFVVAFRIPNLFRDLLAEGALSAAFVPTFTAALKGEGQEAAERLAALVLGGILVVTGLLTVLGIVFAEPTVTLISGNFGGDPAKVAAAVELTRLLMPFLALASIGAVFMGMLNAQRRFLVPALGPAMFNVVSMLAGGVVWLLGADTDTAILVWAGGTLAGGVVQTGMQVVALWRRGFRIRIALAGIFRHPGVRRIAMLMAPAVLGVAAIQLNVFVNTNFAGSLGDGPVTQLNYAFRLFFLPLGMFGVALATVTMTSVSEAAAAGDHSELARRAGDGVSAGWMLTSASAVGLFALALPVVELLYHHGRTTSEDALAIAACLQMYVLGLVPYSLVKILAPAFYSVDRPRIPLLASACGVATNIGFNAMTYRELGAPGIALGTALGAAVNVLVLRAVFGRVVAPIPAEGRLRRFGALLLANLVLGVLAFGGAQGIGWVVERVGVVGLAWKAVLAGLLVVVIGGAGLGYVAVLRALDYPGAAMLLSLPRRVLRRGRGR